MVKIKSYLIDLTCLVFLPVFLSFILYRIIPIQNTNPLSIVSVTASINVILWVLFILQILSNFYFIEKYSIKLIVEINLVLILIYVATFKILIKALSLKGTPLPGSDIRGDLLAIFNLAKEAQLNFWPEGSYPPIWPSLIGNFARILDIPLLALFKPAEFILLVISPIIVLYIWRTILAPWIALIVTINQTLLFDFDYKTLTLNVVIPFLIYTLIEAKKVKTNSLFKFYGYGFFVGFFSLMYFGYIYWLIPLLAGITLISIISKDKVNKLKRQTYVYLGLGTGLGPVVYSIVLSSIYHYYVLILILLLVIISLRRYKKIENIFHFLINTGLLLVLIGAILFYRANDTWVEGGIDKYDPTVISVINLSGTNLLIFLILLLGAYFVLRTNKDITIIGALVGVYLSSALFMYFIASQMQVTYRVDLWPRASEVQYYSLNLIFLILFLYIIEILISENNYKKYFILSKHRIYLFVSLILFIIGSYLISSLGSSTYSSMPYHAFTPAWFAHQGCSNPHEDPMLSKVFETNSDIQDFLRLKCPSANWPIISRVDN
jgi:hypothetical protein